VSLTERATELLHAFARSDVSTLERLCADNVLVWGTDEGEVWRGKQSVVSGFAGAFDLDVRWLEEPLLGAQWVAGLVEFVLPSGERLAARVTMAFEDELLSHAHYSVPLPVEASAQ
jgi:hypothetical protein